MSHTVRPDHFVDTPVAGNCCTAAEIANSCSVFSLRLPNGIKIYCSLHATLNTRFKCYIISVDLGKSAKYLRLS